MLDFTRQFMRIKIKSNNFNFITLSLLRQLGGLFEASSPDSAVSSFLFQGPVAYTFLEDIQ